MLPLSPFSPGADISEYSNPAPSVAPEQVGVAHGSRMLPAGSAMVAGMSVRDSRVHNYPPRWNGAPSQELLVIRSNHKTGEVSLDPHRALAAWPVPQVLVVQLRELQTRIQLAESAQPD